MTVLGLVMFLQYINDNMMDEVDSYIRIVCWWHEVVEKVENNMDCEMLQQDLDKIYDWGKG